MARSGSTSSVQVRFVSDDDVLEHIYSLSDTRNIKRKTSRRKLSVKKSAKDDEIEEEVAAEEVPVPLGLHVQDGSTTGRQMFSLEKTPSSKYATKTDKTKTPRSSANEKKDTPYKLRRKVKQKLSKMKAEHISSDETDSDRSSDDEEYKEDTEADVGNYFTFVSKSKTSNHMLSKLGHPMLGMEEINQILGEVKDPVAKHRRKLLQEHQCTYPKWMALLLEGFNLLLYGVGSKMRLMQCFKENFLSEYVCVTINGFNPCITTQEIVTTILRQVMREESLIPGLANQVEQIREHYSQKDADHLFLLVNNLDGSGLRSSKAQGVFVELAHASRIHIVASVDHINASLLWDQERLKTLSFVWINATTFEPYVLESSLEPLKNNAATTLSSLQHVFCSLTPNAKKIFLLIAQHQLDHKDAPGYVGLSFQDCYKRCREAFLVNSDLTLRTQLTEFLDHMLLKIKKSHDGVENLTIPVDDGTLSIFVGKQGGG